MKKLSAIIVAIFICSGIALLYLVPERGISTKSPYNITTHNKDRKKILILSCKGGGGHISAANAITAYLEPDYCIGSAFVFADVLRSIDIVSKIHDKGAMDLYNNTFAKKNWNKFTNTMSLLVKPYLGLRKRTIAQLFEQYLCKHKPDLIISVTPLINKGLLKAAQKLNIPFLLIPTDLDGANAVLSIKKPQYDKFHLGLSYEYKDLLKTVEDAQIDPKYISYVGFPVQPAFLQPSNTRATKKIFNIPDDKPVILLMMGSQGSSALYTYTKQLAKLTIPAHLVIILGKSSHLAPKLRSIHFPQHISHTILEFTNRIPELMSVADLLISKSGGVSVNEAIYSNIPMLLDATASVLRWEAFNREFVKKHGLGKTVKKIKQLPQLVERMISPEEQAKLKTNFTLFDKKNPEQEIKKLVKRMLG